jgi:hypothetical protein
MGLISFTAVQNGTAPDASQVNNPLNTIYDEFNGNITSANLASNAVTTNKVQDSAITTAKIDDGAVTTAKLASATQNNLLPEVFQQRATATTGIANTIVNINGTSITFTAHVTGKAFITGTVLVDITSSGTVDGIIRITNGADTELTADNNYIAGRFIGTGTGVRGTATAYGIVDVTEGVSYTYKLRASGSSGQTFNIGVGYSGIRIEVGRVKT